MKRKTLSIGGATYDLFVCLPHDVVHAHSTDEFFRLPLGAKIRAEKIVETCGGGAANTSVGLARLGCEASFEGVIGSDQWGEKLLANFRKQGVRTDAVTIVEGETTSFSIILLGGSRERVILYQPSTNTHLKDMTFDKEILKRVDWVYLNHLSEESCEIENDIVEMLSLDGAPLLTWNPGGCQIGKGLEEKDNASLLARTQLLLVNKEEALALSRTTDIPAAIKAFLKGGAKIVCVTDGKNGAFASDGTSILRCPILPNIAIVNTTGAGDAFGTGMTWGLLSGLTLPESMKAGTISAGSVVANMGSQTGLLTDIEMRQKLKECSLEVDTHSL